MRPGFISTYLSLGVILGLHACAPPASQTGSDLPLASPSPPVVASPGPTTTQSPTSSPLSGPDSAALDFASKSLGLQATYRQDLSNPSDPLPLKDYPLPRGVKLSEIQIEKVLLDGKVIPSENLQLSLDPKGNLIFLLKAAQELISEVSDLPDITQSPLFQARQTALQDRLLAGPAPAPPTAVSKPSFLQARVRGEQLTRQQMATLSAGAGELAKSGVYLDRQFSVILSVRNQSFVVAQERPRFLVLGFELRGDMLQQWAAQSPITAEGINLLPLIVNSDAKDLLTEVADLEAGLAQIEKALHEHILSLLLGPETAEFEPGRDNLRDFKVKLSEALWNDIQTQLPGNSLNTAQTAPTLTQLLAASASYLQVLQSRFESHGRTPVSDEQLFNDQPESLPVLDILRILPEQLQTESNSCIGEFSTQSLDCKAAL